MTWTVFPNNKSLMIEFQKYKMDISNTKQEERAYHHLEEDVRKQIKVKPNLNIKTGKI